MLGVSIIIPTYNERENIVELVRRISAVLSGRDYEILVVDDDSPDGTGDVVKALSGEISQLRLITRRRKEGIGAALREGYGAATKDVLLSMDADLSFRPEDIPRLLERIESGYDLALGCRHAAGGGYETPTLAVRLKFLVSWLGNRAVRRLLGLDVADYSANFRAIRRSVWDAIETKDNTNFLLLETILKVQAKGYRIAQVPVFFADRRHGKSKLNLWTEVPKFLLRLIRYVGNFS